MLTGTYSFWYEITSEQLSKTNKKDVKFSNYQRSKYPIANTQIQTKKIAANSNEHDLDRKRENYITWNQYFIGVALLAAKRSSVLDAQGACVVNENKRIVSVGYKKPISSSAENEECCAEMVSVFHEINMPLAGCGIYLTHFPCNHCTKLQIQAGIKRVVYISKEVLTADEKQDMSLSNKLFFVAKVDVQEYCSEDLP